MPSAGTTSSSPSPGCALRHDRIIALPTTSQGADCFAQQILDIVRAAVFQKALDSTKQITPENLPETVPTAAFWVIFIDAWAYLSIALPKLGVGILIIRIFNPQRWLKVTIMTLCVALNILAVIGFIITFVQCNPAVGQWDPFRYPQTRCWNRAVGLLYACTVSGMYLRIKPRGLSVTHMNAEHSTQEYPPSWTLPSLSILALLSGACRCQRGRSSVRRP